MVNSWQSIHWWGELWARAGCVLLAAEGHRQGSVRLGEGEAWTLSVCVCAGEGRRGREEERRGAAGPEQKNPLACIFSSSRYINRNLEPTQRSPRV